MDDGGGGASPDQPIAAALGTGVLSAIRNPDRYWQAVVDLLEGYGAWLMSKLAVERAIADDGALRAVKIGPNSALVLEDTHRLDFTIWIDATATQTRYFFAFVTPEGVLWRKCMHEGHEDEADGLTHLHCPQAGRETRPYPEIDLQEALNEAYDYIGTRTVPC